MVVEIRLNNTWQDISNSIIQPIAIDRRVDEVLDSGTFTFVSKTIDYNIPPLTLCKIDSEYWLCSSECNEVIPSSPKEYNHNVSLIELTYYLQCYIVGTKAMSNTGTMYPTNADKCKALCDIVNDKYRLIFGNNAVKFEFESNAFSDSRWQLEREFIFGSGTTLFQALLDIGRTCNSIPIITEIKEYSGTRTDYNYEVYILCINDNGEYETEHKHFSNLEDLDFEAYYESIKDNPIISIYTEAYFMVEFNDIGPNADTTRFKINNIREIKVDYNGFHMVHKNLIDGQEFYSSFSAPVKYYKIKIEHFKNMEQYMPSMKVLNGSTAYVNWDLLDNNQTFTLDSTKILTMQYRQSVDDYTAILESEVSDVVDRTTSTRVESLTVRSENYIINDDNQVLILPTRAESITKFEVNLFDRESHYYEYILLKNNQVLNSYNESDKNINDSYWDTIIKESTLQNIRNYLNSIGYGEVLIHMMPITTDLKISNYDYILSFTGIAGQLNNENISFDITKSMLEKSQYDLLDALDKTKYCYYTYNDRIIRGIYTIENDNFWGAIIGTFRFPFLHYAQEQLNEQNLCGNFHYVVKEKFDGDDAVFTRFLYNGNNPNDTDSINPRDFSFNIEYTPITSTFLLSNNDKEPFNETQVKNVTRSFELSSSMSDFDLLVDSINKNNNMLGMPEVSFEYYGMTYPKPRNIISIKNQNYYVSSVQTTIILGQYKSVVNLVKEYNKIAEVFGVKTQFESTKLPLNSIVDRIVYCGEFANVNKNIDLYINVKDISNTFNLFKRSAKVINENNYYIIIEATDNYCFDTASVSNSYLSNGEENKEYPYANSNNEQIDYLINIVGVVIADKNASKSLPLNNNLVVTTYASKQVKLYKDARERLIFVAKLK